MISIPKQIIRVKHMVKNNNVPPIMLAKQKPIKGTRNASKKNNIFLLSVFR